MSISDRLDEITARAEAVVGLTLRDDNARDAYNIVEDDVPDLVAAVRAVLDACDESTIQARPHGDGEPYMIVRADDVRNAIATALGEETP